MSKHITLVAAIKWIRLFWVRRHWLFSSRKTRMTKAFNRLHHLGSEAAGVKTYLHSLSPISAADGRHLHRWVRWGRIFGPMLPQPFIASAKTTASPTEESNGADLRVGEFTQKCSDESCHTWGGLCRFTAAPTASSQAIKPPQEGFYCPSSSPKATFLLPSLPYLWECIEVSWQSQKLISFELKSYNCLLHFGLSHCPQMDGTIEVLLLHGHA